MVARKRPRPAKPETFEALTHNVEAGYWRMYQSPDELPHDIPWAGRDCMAVLVAASTYDAESAIALHPAPEPGGPVFYHRSWRADSQGKPHWNEYDTLYYESGDGQSWMINSRDSPDHFKEITSGSAMDDLVRDYSLPAAASGTLKELRQTGTRLDFEEPLKGRS